MLLTADRVFDGHTMRVDAAVLIEGGLVRAVGPVGELTAQGLVIDLGDATILPGFIEPHAHARLAGVSLDVVVRHGITTLQDLGGPLRAPEGGRGSLRLLSAGPILTAPGGYPIPAFGQTGLARVVTSDTDGRAAVRELTAGGASIIKIALEPGGEPGAPWMRHGPHGGAGEADLETARHTTPRALAAHAPWPMLSPAIVAAIVDEAHRLGKRTIAHLSDDAGVTVALDAGVDAWAHVPCLPVDGALLRRAAERGTIVVTTLDTLSACPGTEGNAGQLVAFGAPLIYGSEIAHADVPWGIDAEELDAMRAAGLGPLDVLRAATSRSGEALGLAPLGSLLPGAPADIVAVRGDVMAGFKRLEYPDLVVSGGQIVVNRFAPPARRAAGLRASQ
ncbi:MAG: amidohydrolase family protein [Vicinamibacterales bacterium]